MPKPRILLVDDDRDLRELLVATLEQDGFEVTEAGDVNEALRHIASNSFDALVSDLHMPGAADGLTVISAMRHANPKTVTILFSAFPQMDIAVKTILAQTDQILVKPSGIRTLATTIRARLANDFFQAKPMESVATILERSIEKTMEAWYARVEQDKELMTLPLSREERTGYIPHILTDVVHRLRSDRPLGDKNIVSKAAHHHGLLRREQGYSAAMMVNESRALQVSIFETLNKNAEYIDFSLLLKNVMAIADEVDSQLSQAVMSYRNESVLDSLPA
jgi:DNA-binding response OmpR family regulator